MDNSLKHLIKLGTQGDPNAVSLEDLEKLEENNTDNQFDKDVYAHLEEVA